MDQTDRHQLNLAEMRREYARGGLDESLRERDPVEVFSEWFEQARDGGVGEPNAMALATANAQGTPSVRIVLLKHLDESGAVFFTHRDSLKGRQLAENPRAACDMLWHDVGRQVRFSGPVEEISDSESDDYFASRPLGAQLSAIASPQSQPVADRHELVARRQAVIDSGAIVRPERWGGYRVAIERIEFWQGGADRLHDRIEFWRQAEGWSARRLAP